ncbi:MAG: hypothetical protein ACLGGX_01120 [Bdellovibrionia bacterium]
MSRLVDSSGWRRVNQTLKNSLTISDENQLWLHASLPQAVFDVIYGGAQFNAHKKSIAYIRGRSNLLDSILPLFYKQNYNVQSTWHSQLKQVAEWVGSLKPDTLMVVIFADHAVTGESAFYVDELVEALSQKKIFAIVISHHQRFKKSPRPYEVQISPLNSHAAISVIGTRFKAPALITPLLDWGDISPEIHHFTSDLLLEDSVLDLIEKRKTDLPESYSLMGCDNNTQKIIVSSNDIASEYIIYKLKKSFSTGVSEIITTHFCHDGYSTQYKNWWESCPQPNTLRGLLVLPWHLALQESFWAEFKTQASDILQKTIWK